MSAQTWNAEGYAKNARFVTDLGAPVLELLAAQPGESVLDIGCGDGVLTKKIAEVGSRVVGLDSSREFCVAARRLGIHVVELSASDMKFEGEFDAVFSNAALHWMKDAGRVAENVARALRTGGRFVAEMGGYRCVENVRVALIDELNRRGYDGASASPWYFPSPDEYSVHLRNAGFAIPYIELIPRHPVALSRTPEILKLTATFAHEPQDQPICRVREFGSPDARSGGLRRRSRRAGF
jgi:SAM-dependent methyltransferase